METEIKELKEKQEVLVKEVKQLKEKIEKIEERTLLKRKENDRKVSSEDIGQILINFSERLSKLTNPKEKIDILNEIDNFLLEHKKIIKEKYSSLVTGIFRSI